MTTSWDAYFLAIIEAVRLRANCSRRKVAAIVVKDHRIIATGYNGTGSGQTNCLDGGCERCANPERYGPGEGYDRCLCVHAEANCIAVCARFGIAMEGASVYTTLQPCFECLRNLVQAGVAEIVWVDEWTTGNPSYDYLAGQLGPGFRQVKGVKHGSEA